MLAERDPEHRTRFLVRHEWRLPQGVGRAQVDRLFDLAGHERDQETGPHARVELAVIDGWAVVGYTAEVEPEPGRRECGALCADVERDWDEWERRTFTAVAKVARASALAESWAERARPGLEFGDALDTGRQQAFLDAAEQLAAALADTDEQVPDND